jgi:hypothetical protein
LLLTGYGASSNLGHSLQYEFDWGDQTPSQGWGSLTQSHAYNVAGRYNLRARARCATHTNVESSWSGTLKSVTIISSNSGEWFINPANGHEYKLTSPLLTWEGAEAEANAAGGHLATIRNSSENQWMLENFDPDSINFWIGLYQPAGSSEPSGGWRWASGEPTGYTNWAFGEPSDSNGDEDHAEFKGARSSAPGKWNDAGSLLRQRGVVERSLDTAVNPESWLFYE